MSLKLGPISGGDFQLMSITIIVEGKNDRSRLRRVLVPEVEILCTFGTLNTLKLESLRQQVGDGEVYLYLDNDSSGKKYAVFSVMLSPMPVTSILVADMLGWRVRPMNTISLSLRKLDWKISSSILNPFLFKLKQA